MSKSTIILIIFLGVVTFRLEEYLIAKNYILFTHMPCNPSEGTCFSTICDPQDSTCSEEKYTKVQIFASDAPSCVVENNCDTNICNEVTCTELSCTPATIEDYEKCSTMENDV